MTTPFEVEEAVRQEAIAAGQCAHCMTRYPMADSERIYIETSGTNCQVGGHQCRVMSVHHASPMTAIVTAWHCPAVYHVTLGWRHGDREQWADVAEVREVATRDEFDAITGLDQVRREMGWPT